MFSLMNLLEYNSIWFNVCVVVLVIYLTYYIKNIVSYPRGPFPLPIVGNIIPFRGKLTDTPVFVKMTEWAERYGPIYTVWAGHTPIIIVNSFELITEASIEKKNDFIYRSDASIHRLIKNGTHNVFSSNGPYWEALRKVAHFAIRRFAVNERLPQMVNEIMDESVDLMVKEKQLNPLIYVEFMVYNILAMIAYGEKLGQIDDQIFKEAKRLNTDFYEVSGNGLISDYIPWLKPFYHKRVLALKDMVKASTDITKNAFFEHKMSFTPGIIRDFSDCVLEAKEEAIRENFDRNKLLNDDNLFMVVGDLFIAGTDTTQTTIRWAILMLANDPTLQQKMFDEINDNIGDRLPTHEDKNVLPLTYAFLLEVLRFRPAAPVGVDHMTAIDTELAGHKLPKDTIVLFNILQQNNDPNYWTNPDKFDPGRFLDSNGKLKSGRFSSFVTFGLGRRGCPGEKLAINNSFIMITRLVQRAKIELPGGSGSADVVPLNVITACFPRDYDIICTYR